MKWRVMPAAAVAVMGGVFLLQAADENPPAAGAASEGNAEAAAADDQKPEPSKPAYRVLLSPKLSNVIVPVAPGDVPEPEARRREFAEALNAAHKEGYTFAGMNETWVVLERISAPRDSAPAGTRRRVVLPANADAGEGAAPDTGRRGAPGAR